MCCFTDQEAEEVGPVRELGSESEGIGCWEGGGQAEQFHGDCRRRRLPAAAHRYLGLGTRPHLELVEAHCREEEGWKRNGVEGGKTKEERKGDTMCTKCGIYTLPLLNQVGHLHIFVVIDTHM